LANDKYYKDAKKRQTKKEKAERIADIYLKDHGFNIIVNPKESNKACDRLILNEKEEIIAGIEYKGKWGKYPPALFLDDKVFANLINWAYKQQISRETLFIAYYNPEKRHINKDWLIFRATDLLTNGIGRKQHNLKYKSPGVETYILQDYKLNRLTQHELYHELYPPRISESSTLADLIRGAKVT